MYVNEVTCRKYPRRGLVVREVNNVIGRLELSVPTPILLGEKLEVELITKVQSVRPA